MPASASAALERTQHLDRDSGLSALGRDYEKKKQKLLLELQLEYKDYVAKKNDSKTRVVDGQHQGLTLLIEEKVSTKEGLRDKRQKQCNLFLQEQAQNRRVKRGTPPVPSKPEPQASAAVNITSPGPPLSFLNTQMSTAPHQRESPESRKNAATPTRAGDNGRSSRRRRRWQIHQPKKTHSSEEELNTDEEEDFDFRGRDSSTYEQEYNEESGTPERRGRRALQNTRRMEAFTIQDQNSNDGIWKADISQTPQNMKTTARSTPNKAEKTFATGLIIGAAEERSVTQMKKEQYRQELLRQIAEQQENKIKEKKAVLKVGATEATAPGKEPETKQWFGAASQQPESLKRDVADNTGFDPKCDNPVERPQHRTLGQNSLVGFSPAFSQLPGNTLPLSGMGAVQAFPPFNYYSGFTGMQGQVAFPWVPVVPPVPHMVSNADMSRHDAAFYQEGTRSQDPYSNQNLSKDRMLGGPQQETYETPPPRPPSARANNGSPLDIEGLQADGSMQRTESTQSYREALRQQVTEKEECTRKEKEEKRRDVAQLEAEVVVYDPWGKGGAGAPIKDKQGNLVSDLYHMHKINNNRMTSLRPEAGAPISQQELSHHLPLQQDRYKEELKQQMEEKKRKQAEEQEHLKILEETEAKRLAMDRARMQQQYEDEQRREKQIRNKHKRSNQAETRDTKEDISKGQKIQSAQRNERGPSPAIPTLQKHTNVTSRPSSVVSPLKSRTELIVSAPNTQPVPESKPSAPAGQQEVIRELSALRNLLRREQRKLELQLDQTETHRSHLNNTTCLHPGDKTEGSRFPQILYRKNNPPRGWRLDASPWQKHVI